MRNLALSVAAILVLAVASPAFAQPFADVPTDHWAFDAIAELAAKGIIEGFPDGTFKGDRGVSRYEVAIIVARILARIEAIKIPAPAPVAAPQVTRTDVQTIQRLVNEFRAELAALGVRTTAVEEELTALKAKTTNVSTTGDLRIRYNFPNNAFTATRYRSRLTFTGSATPAVKVVGRAVFGAGSAASSNYTFGNTLGEPFKSVTFDRAYVDFANILGWGMRAGQWDPTLGTGVGWSGYGLLFDPGNAGVFAPIGMVDGVRFTNSISGFNLELAGYRLDNTAGFDIYTARAETAGLLPGWTVGVDYLYQHRNSAMTGTLVSAITGGPYGPLVTAPGAGGVTVATAGANTNDTGWQVDVTGSLFPGLGLGAAYAQFNPDPGWGTSSPGYIGWVTLDLSSMGMGMGLSPTLTAWYKNYGSSTAGAGIPFHSGASTEIGTTADLTWNFNGWGTALDYKISANWSGSLSYESGTKNVGGAAVTEYYASFDYAVAPKSTLSFRYFKTTVGATDSNNFYRVQLTTSF
jgi:hypothetical protein